MKLIKQRLSYTSFPKSGEVYLFTANNTLTSGGELVMGRGNALSLKQCVPSAPKKFGKLVKSNPNTRVHLSKLWKGYIGSFQTKEFWRNKSNPRLVKESMNALQAIAEDNPETKYHLPFPAINNGGMDYNTVLAMLELLPNNVHVYLGE